MEDYVIITVLYRDKEFKSMPIKLESNSEAARVVMAISETGSNNLSALKLPLTGNSFVMISKAQLDESFLRVDIVGADEIKKSVKKKTSESQAN